MREIQWQIYGTTIIHPLSLTLILLMGILILFLEKPRSIVIPVLIGSFFITEMQRIVIASLDFNMMRILLIFGWIRIILRGETRGFRVNRIDSLIILYAVSKVLFYSLQWRTSAAFINGLGGMYTLLGFFFLFRAVVRGLEDIIWVFKVLAVICVPIALAMFLEYLTHQNIFAVFGGVPSITIVREGRLRGQAAFSHPILAGTFGATLLPLFTVLWLREAGKKSLFIIGTAAAFAITFFSSSSGPVISLAAGILGVALWPLRRSMGAVKWGVVAMLVLLQIVMKAPVWALIARVGVVGGSTGYHRFALLDNFIRRFGEWFLLGTRSTAHWGWGLQDVTNQYVRIGVNGGIVTLLLFLSIIYFCYKAIHKSLLSFTERWQKYTAWALGSALFAHLVSFIGVSYFDQIIVSWYLLLAMISTVESVLLRRGAYVYAYRIENESCLIGT